MRGGRGFAVAFTFLSTVSGDGSCREAAVRQRRRRGAAAARRKQQAIGVDYLFRISRADGGGVAVAGRRARVYVMGIGKAEMRMRLR